MIDNASQAHAHFLRSNSTIVNAGAVTFKWGKITFYKHGMPQYGRGASAVRLGRSGASKHRWKC